MLSEISIVLLEIDFDADNQDDIVRTFKKLSYLMRKRNIELSQTKELLCEGKIEYTKIFEILVKLTLIIRNHIPNFGVLG